MNDLSINRMKRIQHDFDFIAVNRAMPNISSKAKWTQNGITVAGGNGPGNAINQLNNPHSLHIDDDQNIYVAEYPNHRIVQWKNDATHGQVVAGGNGAGNRNDQLNTPRNVLVDKQNESLIICDHGNRRVVRWPCRQNSTGETIISNIDCSGVAMDKDGYLYISDYVKHEVRRWKIGEKDGTLVAGGNGAGNGLNQLNQPYQIFVDQDQSVYVSNYGNHRVMKWMKGAEEGVVVAGSEAAGNALKQLSSPGGVVVDQSGTVYVAEYLNHRVVRWLKGANEGSVIVGGNGSGAQANQFNGAWNLSFDLQNNLYVVDHVNHRIQKFSIESD